MEWDASFVVWNDRTYFREVFVAKGKELGSPIIVPLLGFPFHQGNSHELRFLVG